MPLKKRPPPPRPPRTTTQPKPKKPKHTPSVLLLDSSSDTRPLLPKHPTVQPVAAAPSPVPPSPRKQKRTARKLQKRRPDENQSTAARGKKRGTLYSRSAAGPINTAISGVEREREREREMEMGRVEILERAARLVRIERQDYVETREMREMRLGVETRAMTTRRNSYPHVDDNGGARKRLSDIGSVLVMKRRSTFGSGVDGKNSYPQVDDNGGARKRFSDIGSVLARKRRSTFGSGVDGK